MINKFKQFESLILSFKKGWERVQYQSKEMDKYWVNSQRMRYADLNLIKRWFLKKGLDFEIKQSFHQVSINEPFSDGRRNSNYDRNILDKSNLWYITIWEAMLDEDRGYFNITLHIRGSYRGGMGDYYFTTDSIYGVLDFFEDLFSEKVI